MATWKHYAVWRGYFWKPPLLWSKRFERPWRIKTHRLFFTRPIPCVVRWRTWMPEIRARWPLSWSNWAEAGDLRELMSFVRLWSGSLDLLRTPFANGSMADRQPKRTDCFQA